MSEESDARGVYDCPGPGVAAGAVDCFGVSVCAVRTDAHHLGLVHSAAALGNLRTNRLRLSSGSFALTAQFEKQEIHTVFLCFPNLLSNQNLSLSALADLFRASLEFCQGSRAHIIGSDNRGKRGIKMHARFVRDHKIGR